MPQHSETRVLPYTASQIYALVADVGSYPQFLPWCAAARVKSRSPAEHHDIIEADLVISFKVFREKFGSRVELWPDDLLIKTEYIDGPFRYMHSNWKFEDVENGCRVAFDVDFEFKNAILQRVIGLVFKEAMQRVVKAFERRADDLYGSK